MKAIQKINTETGEATFIPGPEPMLPKMLAELKGGFAGRPYTFEVVEMASGGRFISPDEQRASMTAIEEEQQPSQFCPDCGRQMDYDGHYYCEYCEG